MTIKLIQPADPVYRRQLLWSGAFIAAIALAGLLWALYYLNTLQSLAEADPRLALEKMTFFFKVLTVLGMIDLCSGGVFLLWLGQRTLNTAQYPPPDTPVAWDTRIRFGAEAHRHGMIHFVLGNLIVLSALAGGFFLLWWLSQP